MRKYCLINLLILIGVIPIYAQKEQTEICIDFRVNSIVIDSLYNNNAERLDEILRQINQLRCDTMRSVTQVTFCGVASPEGNYHLNRRLATNRRIALENYIRSHINFPEELVIYDYETYIPWKYLISQVEASELPQKKEVLSILQEPVKFVPYHNGGTIDSRVPALQKLDKGKVWRILLKRFFPKMRNACFVLVTLKDFPKQKPIAESKPNFARNMPTMNIRLTETPIICPSVPSKWTHSLYLKSNAIGLALGMANVSVEIDLAKHFSFALPVYYSAWNYFKSTIKFRTLGFQPELRYWFSEENDGLFSGIHFGLAYYNFAFDKAYRYQDHNRETPAIGGGLCLGYRKPISKDNRWKLEFSLGAGVYPLHYDKFHNTSRTKDGLMIESIKKTYWGIDQGTVSLSYTFNLKKKGGAR